MENTKNDLSIEHKSNLIAYLEKKSIYSVDKLWALTKDYYKKLDVPCGGSFASWQDYISVHIAVTPDEHYRFNMSLKEVNN